MGTKKIVILCGIVAGIFIIIGGGYVFANAHRATDTAQTFPAEANAALNQTVNGMSIPGIIVPPQWKIASMQLAPSPAALQPQRAVTGQAKIVWCVVIAPGISALATKRTPAVTLNHFLVVQTAAAAASQWTAVPVDGLQVAQGQNAFQNVGCTNG